MRLCYTLLSPTFGMHQYSADLANRQQANGVEVHLVTTPHLPRDRYAPGVAIHTPVTITGAGFSLQGLRLWGLRELLRTILDLQPDLLHITGPHLWNPLLLSALRRFGVPTVHTLHDLHPHAGAVYGRLLYLWNGWVRRAADHLLVHGQRYRDELLGLGVPPSRVTCAPLTHLFMSYARERELDRSMPAVRYEPWALFLGRLEAYKGLNVLVEAARWAGRDAGQPIKVVIAGPGQLNRFVHRPLPANVEVREQLVGDEEAIELFSRCGLVVLPYIEASQSALVAAAYYFRKPVIVTSVGALPEYVVAGETGWVIPPNSPQALAQALQAALGDRPRLARMGQASREWYQRQRQGETVTLHEMYTHSVGRR